MSDLRVEALTHVYSAGTPFEKTAIDHVRDYCKANPDQETCFVACGGDGTINEVATGMVGAKNKHLAVLAYGSGNDFIKYYPGKDFLSVADLVKGTAHKIDILKVGQDHYSINVCNFGFDSVVASTANKLSRKGNKNPYRWGIVKAIFCGRFNSIQVKADGELLNEGKRMLLVRRLYDTLAFFMALAKLHGGDAKAIIRAHRDYRTMRGRYTCQPSTNLLHATAEGRRNIVVEYYLLRRKRF